MQYEHLDLDCLGSKWTPNGDGALANSPSVSCCSAVYEAGTDRPDCNIVVFIAGIPMQQMQHLHELDTYEYRAIGDHCLRQCRWDLAVNDDALRRQRLRTISTGDHVNFVEFMSEDLPKA